MDHKIKISAFILGLSTLMAQIVIIRELLVSFYGNELTLGVILASWLFWVAFGSSIIGKTVDKLASREKLLSYLLLSVSILLPLNIFLIRNIKSILSISTGEILNIVPIFIICNLSLSLLCIIFGFLFTLISSIASVSSGSPSKEIGKVYFLEALGASIGGLLISLALIKILSPFEIIFIIAAFNLLASLLFNKNIFQVVCLIAISWSFLFNIPGELEQYTRSRQFKPFELAESIDSIYGNISVVKDGAQTSFYENGVLMFSYPDEMISEEATHYALLEHKDPKTVLLIGGGMGGALKEILKHAVEKIDYVELDPLIVKLSKKYLPEETDKKINIINTDGRLFVKNTANSYDVIILNLPDPYTALINRFYSLEFFEEAKRILKKNGVISFRVTSSENYINREQAFYLAGLYNTLKNIFSDVIVLPGDSAIYLATDSKNLLTYDPAILIERLKKRNISTRFVREYYIPFRLDPLRIKYLKDSIEGINTSKINKDFRPISYLYYTNLWMSKFSAKKTMLGFIDKIDFKKAFSIIILIFIILLLLLKKYSFRVPVMISIGTTGMSEIAFQIIVILSFQFLYGYVYYKIGLILTSFMIGIVLGSYYMTKNLDRLENEKDLFIKIQLLVGLYPVVLIISLLNIAKIGSKNILEPAFILLPILAGIIGGLQWPLANKICLQSNSQAGKTAGILYGIDVFGSCISALLISLILVPIIGIIKTLILLSLINLGIFILLLIVKYK
ncbi:MAG: hypothetical protein ABH848_03270 [Candidatus Omnitrophota bacterium]